jgi:hypothetical protein
MPVDVEILRKIPLFATLKSEDLAHVAAMTVVKSLAIETRQGRAVVLSSERLCLIASGE